MKRREAMKKSGLLAGALAGGNLLAGAGEERFTIALVMKALSNPFFHAMEVGAREEAQNLGIELIVNGINRETDVAQQITLVENAMTRRVDAIVIAPASSAGLIPVLMRAQAQGVFVVNIDNPLDEPTKKSMGFECPFVGSDNAKGAALACHDLVAAMGGEGEVAILEGIPGVINAELRKRGARRVLDAEPGIEVVASQTAEWETESAFRVFSNMLTANPGIRGLFASNDNMALGAARAIDSAGKAGQIVITSYDNLEAAQDAIKRGVIHSTIEQHPAKMGAYGVKAAYDHLRGETIPNVIPTPLEVIDYKTLMFQS